MPEETATQPAITEAPETTEPKPNEGSLLLDCLDALYFDRQAYPATRAALASALARA